MSDKSNLKGVELNGVLYSLGVSIYDELGLSLERFVELLGRDLYCPTLSAEPTSSTLQYTDTDNDQHTFQLGQPCRWKEGDGYRLAVCTDITADSATWYVFPVKVSELANDAEYVTASFLSSSLSDKQDKLVSGTNVKTINGVSLLESGDIGMIWTTETNGVDYPSVTIN